MKQRGPRISEPKVLQSAAGYYIGRTWRDDDGDEQPYDRLSGYYPSQEIAEEVLYEEDWIW